MMNDDEIFELFAKKRQPLISDKWRTIIVPLVAEMESIQIHKMIIQMDFTTLMNFPQFVVVFIRMEIKRSNIGFHKWEVLMAKRFTDTEIWRKNGIVNSH